MSWPIWIGMRYLYSKKNTKFLSFITTLAFFGITLGVASMIVVLSVMSGFERELKKRLFKGQPHIILETTDKTPGYKHGLVPTDILWSSSMRDLITSMPEVEHCVGSVQAESILKVYQKIAGVVVKGLPLDEWERKEASLIEKIDPALLSEHSFSTQDHVFIGEQLALELSLIPGDTLNFISPLDFDGPMSSAPRIKKALLAGIYRTGSAEQELHYILTHQAWVWSFLQTQDVLSHLEFTLYQAEESEKVIHQLTQSIDFEKNGFRIFSWKEMNAQLFASLQLERLGMFIALSFIILVASFNIVTVLMLMILEKKKEIAILLTLGAQKRQVNAIFLTQGFLIGFFGLSFGVIVAYSVCWFLSSSSWFQLPEIYYDKNLPVAFEAKYYLMIVSFSCVIVFLASLYPAKHAALRSITKSLRG